MIFYQRPFIILTLWAEWGNPSEDEEQPVYPRESNVALLSLFS